jgi:hypothetical protein
MEATATAQNPTEASTAPAAAEVPATPVVETPVTEQPAAAEKTTLLSETKPAEAKTEEVKVEAVAPEKYEFKIPEGAEVDASVVDAFSDAAKGLKLSQEAAQSVVDKVIPAMQARQAAQIQAIHEGWQTSARVDKEFGGEKLTENLAVAKKALDQFGTPELKTLLNASGLGNNPEVIRLLYRAGKAISEEKYVGGTKSDPTSPVSLYPNSNMK